MSRMARSITLPLLGLVLAVLLTGTVCGRAGAGEARAGLDIAIAARMIDESRTVAGQRVDLPLLRRVYAQRGFAPLWLTPEGTPRPQAAAVLAVVQGAAADGLSPADYHPDAIAARLTSADAAARTELEVLLTDAVMAYGVHLRAGRVAPRAISTDFALVPAAVDPMRIVADAAEAAEPARVLAALAPPQPAYAALKTALQRLRAVEAGGGWPVVPSPRTAKLEPGRRDPAVAALRRRLAASGEFVGKVAGGDLYDAALKGAVVRFQTRHGLDADGVVGPGTLVALNVPVAERIGQILANLERERWMPADLGRRHVVVNVPDYSLKAVEDGTVVDSMRVIVGTKVRRTPIFSSSITSVVLNPTWTMPVRLAKEDYLPKLLKNPGYLAEKGFTVYASWAPGAPALDPRRINWKAVGNGIGRLKLRQDPGPNNALGQVKFNIPNGFDVYLHDTPSRDKFDKTVRAFSSGCVRVGEPMELAAFVLATMPEWPAERRQQMLDRKETKTIVLKEPVPVHLLYRTAWVDAAGDLQFREDVYGRDQELLDAVGRRGGTAAKVAMAR